MQFKLYYDSVYNARLPVVLYCAAFSHLTVQNAIASRTVKLSRFIDSETKAQQLRRLFYGNCPPSFHAAGVTLEVRSRTPFWPPLLA